ncbi:hypothetical protein SAMN02745687_00372 [Lachnospiraceae bacterium NK3A20]|nr:hypothetical protein SAMN02745687_00372 [Lachnospiraceae bacterium NK3A20]
MSATTINSNLLRQMFLTGAANLEANKAWINELNVFPVPDGDTGTNMTMTVVSAVREVTDLGDTDDMRAICKAISSGSLRGARGNSGVILSQLFRGFCKIVRDQKEIDVPLCANAFDKAVETAYKAVMKPKEGTILTVAKGAAEKARELADGGTTDFDEFIPAVIEYADTVLASTPDLLPVLKQAGVVDSGGQGLVQVLKGAYEGYQGKTVDVERLLHPGVAGEAARETEEEEKPTYKFAYETEYMIILDTPMNKKVEDDYRKFLSTYGEDITLLVQPKAIKLHMCTNDPGMVIQKGLQYGQVRQMRVDNLNLKNDPIPEFTTSETEADPAEPTDGETKDPAAAETPHKELGIIAVCAGDGLAEIFKGLGVDVVISGGQTMNPSTADILDAVEKVNADTIFVLPNNKNIILAANQAAAMDGEKKIIVIPTKNVPQGITAVINFMPDLDADANRDNMTEEIGHVKSAEITYAVRDTVIDDVEIREGNMMAIGDAGILGVGDDMNETAAAALEKMIDESTELVSVYYGADITEDDANKLRDKITAAHPACEVDVQNGGQPVYYYILSAE